MEKEDIFSVIQANGFAIVASEDNPTHPNGPAVLLLARLRNDCDQRL
jgi:hypothetical protein